MYLCPGCVIVLLIATIPHRALWSWVVSKTHPDLRRCSGWMCLQCCCKSCLTIKDRSIYLLFVLFHCANPSTPALSPWCLLLMRVPGWEYSNPKWVRPLKHRAEVDKSCPSTAQSIWTRISAIFVKLMHINTWDQSSTSWAFSFFLSSVCPSVNLVFCESIFLRAQLHFPPGQRCRVVCDDL